MHQILNYCSTRLALGAFPVDWQVSNVCAVRLRWDHMVVCALQLYFTCSPDEDKPANGVWYMRDWHLVAEVLDGNATADTVWFALLRKSQDGEPSRSAALRKCATLPA